MFGHGWWAPGSDEFQKRKQVQRLNDEHKAATGQSRISKEGVCWNSVWDSRALHLPGTFHESKQDTLTWDQVVTVMR